MGKSNDDAAPPLISVKKVVDELVALPAEFTAYLNRRTGEVYFVTDEGERALEDPDDPLVPDWQREELPKVREVMESAEWLALPSKFDIHEYSIMKQFCLDLPDGEQREALLDAIHGSGAFRRFKGLVHRYGIQQQWYDYRDREIEAVVANWLDAQGIAYER
ncbi:MAG: UPF0158 family protein [Rhodospirillales bacterium]|nr:UPF0158 family protein [Rhodospirillales bacterium]